MEKIKRLAVLGAALLSLAVLLVPLRILIVERCQVSGVDPGDVARDGFRRQELDQKLLEKLRSAEEDFSLPKEQVLAISMLSQGYEPRKLCAEDGALKKYKPKAYQAMLRWYEAVWGDVVRFPLSPSEVWYEDTWLAERTYGGERSHEGTDLFGEVTVPGYYPVFSMTEGKVEHMGWLPLGGWRIGIRAPKGGYFYYAHLDSFDPALHEGDEVTAGQPLGYMGDSGYGEEGTTGMFPTHLHVGIYLNPSPGEEISVNPYWILRFLQEAEAPAEKK